MKSKKLLRLTIMDAVELVLSQNGIVAPSKKTKKIIIKASEKISNTVRHDLRKSEQRKLEDMKMNRIATILQKIEAGARA